MVLPVQLDYCWCMNASSTNDSDRRLAAQRPRAGRAGSARSGAAQGRELVPRDLGFDEIMAKKTRTLLDEFASLDVSLPKPTEPGIS